MAVVSSKYRTGQLVKRVEVQANLEALRTQRIRLQKKEDAGEVLKELMKVKKELGAQLEHTSMEHIRASEKDPEDIPRGDLAGAQEGILETAEDQMKAALGNLQKKPPEVEKAIASLEQTESTLGLYMDKVKDPTYRSEEEKKERSGDYGG